MVTARTDSRWSRQRKAAGASGHGGAPPSRCTAHAEHTTGDQEQAIAPSYEIRLINSVVIPGRREAVADASRRRFSIPRTAAEGRLCPESITTDRDYGFRTRGLCPRSRMTAESITRKPYDWTDA